jgi:hypothetical protein
MTYCPGLLVETVKTELDGKTMGFDPKTHNLFLTTADFGAVSPAPTKENPEAERKPIPGTFRVLIYGRERDQHDERGGLMPPPQSPEFQRNPIRPVTRADQIRSFEED